MELTYSSDCFSALSEYEYNEIFAGGWKTGVIGAIGGACTGFLAGGKIGASFGPHGFAACVIGGTLGGAITGFVAGY